MPKSPFFTLHSDLPREGPGEPADVHWALSQIVPPSQVIDVACGPGADTVTLAEALPQAQITALDKTPHFVTEAALRVERFGARVSVIEADMRNLPSTADLIWCSGALYFLGVAEGLMGWKGALNPGGTIAFSHPVTQANDPPEVAQFWEGEPGVGPREATEAAIAEAGYKPVGYRRIAGAPWEAYYAPQEARIAKLRAEGASADLEAVLRRTEQEIALWRALPERIAYGLWLVQAQ